MSFNFTPNQAAQGASYAGRAMNAFQTAVNIDDQQPQTPGTTFGFRWFIRVVAVVSGLRKFEKQHQSLSIPRLPFFLSFSCDGLWNFWSIEYITILHPCWCYDGVCIYLVSSCNDEQNFDHFLAFLALH